MKLLASERCADCLFSRAPLATPEERRAILAHMRDTDEAFYCHAYGKPGGIEAAVDHPAVRCRADYDRRRDPAPVDRIVYEGQGPS